MKETGYSRVSKNLIIKELEKELKKHNVFFVSRHDRVSASSMDKLRAKLRVGKARYFAVKNTLGQKALEQAKLKDLIVHLEGSCGITCASGDPILSTKALMDFAKENENFKVQVGYLNGKIVGLDRIKVLASLPGREVLIARVVGQVQAPIARFVSVLGGTLRKFVTVVDAIAKKKSQG